MTTAKDFTSASVFGVYASKTACLKELREAIEGTLDREKLFEILYKFSNTNTGTWSLSATATVADTES